MNKFYNNLNKNYFKKGRTFVIAEIGTNHNQRLSQAKKLIKVAKLAGADAVKFQLLNFEEQFDKNSYSSNFKKNFKKIEFNNNWLSELIEFCKTLESVCIKTVENGQMTKDLALLIHGNELNRSHYLNTQEFLDCIKNGLESSLK